MCIFLGCIGLGTPLLRGNVEGLLLGDLAYLGVFYAWIELKHFGAWTLESIGPSFLLVWFLAAVRTFWLVRSDAPSMLQDTRQPQPQERWVMFAEVVWKLEGYVNIFSALFIATMPERFLASLGVHQASEHACWMLLWWASLLVIPGVLGIRTHISPGRLAVCVYV
jgi:hypothetical protein